MRPPIAITAATSSATLEPPIAVTTRTSARSWSSCMDTSRSPERDRWIAGALVFSGRRDPTWPVPAELGRRLEQLWEGLPPWSGERPHPPPLGYRGCKHSAPGGRVWTGLGENRALATGVRR